MDALTDKNFELFAAKHYVNPNCIDMEEFVEDLDRIKYIKRLFKRYADKGELKERLILNHLITMYNVFHSPALTKMLCYKLQDYIHYLKPFLLTLNQWPTTIDNINGVNIDGTGVPIDNHIESILKEI